MSLPPKAECKAFPLLDFAAQHIAVEAEARVSLERVIQSQQFILGPEVD